MTRVTVLRALTDTTGGNKARSQQLWVGEEISCDFELVSHTGCPGLGRPDPTGSQSTLQAEEESLGKG